MPTKAELEAKLKIAEAKIEELQLELQCKTFTGPTLVPKRGYLYLWQDRALTAWGGTKWSLRFVSLEAGKLSYYGHVSEKGPEYVLTLRGCAVRDEGVKANKHYRNKNGNDTPSLNTVGAYFHIFSIYQRGDDDEEDIVPLLRFSTPSLAEKIQWVTLISDTCAYCDTNDFLEAEKQLSMDLEKRRLEEREMMQIMPEARPGTLAPLIFAKAPPPKSDRRASLKANRRGSYYSKENKSISKLEKKKEGFPPSKPMHRSAAPSYLSPDGPPQSYRGFFNLAMILLVVSNFRLLLQTIRTYGSILTRLQELRDAFAVAPWQDTPLVVGFLFFEVFVVTTYLIEILLSRGTLKEGLGMMLHYVNTHFFFLSSMFIVWNYVENPIVGGILTGSAIILYLKLISYIQANQDYRLSDSYKATLTLVEDLDPGAAEIEYPNNVTLSNLHYFWLAPTLTYQIAFPRTPRVRIWRTLGVVKDLTVMTALFLFIEGQVVAPNLEKLLKDVEANNGYYSFHILAEYGLKLSIASTYAWLLFFVIFFHSFLNILAELLRFGDRVFYKDWWNAAETSAYWRLWNAPVHYWLVRHLYFPCVRAGASKGVASLIVFFISAVFHEVLVAIPFHIIPIRPWAFIGMLLQVPLIMLTKALVKRFPGTSIGNVIFWISFCFIGQPMAVLMYAIDYHYGNKAQDHITEKKPLVRIFGSPDGEL